MAADNNNSARRIQAILDALGESLLDASDEEIADDLKSIGVDPLKVDEQMKFSIDNAVDSFYQTKWQALREQHQQHVNGYEKNVAGIPASPDQCRMLLEQVLAKDSALRSSLTAQFRELEDIGKLSDADVIGIVRNLAALGLVESNSTNNE